MCLAVRVITVNSPFFLFVTHIAQHLGYCYRRDVGCSEIEIRVGYSEIAICVVGSEVTLYVAGSEI